MTAEQQAVHRFARAMRRCFTATATALRNDPDAIALNVQATNELRSVHEELREIMFGKRDSA